MNFVTFNQDYSYLAVGKTYFLRVLPRHFLTRNSDFQGIPYIYDRPLRQKLRNKRGQHRHHRDALFDLFGGFDSLTASPSDHKYQGS